MFPKCVYSLFTGVKGSFFFLKVFRKQNEWTIFCGFWLIVIQTISRDKGKVSGIVDNYEVALSFHKHFWSIRIIFCNILQCLLAWVKS